MHQPKWCPWEGAAWADPAGMIFCSLLNDVREYPEPLTNTEWEEGEQNRAVKIEMLALTWLWQFWEVFYVVIELQRSTLTNTWCKRLFCYTWWHPRCCSTLFIPGPFWKGLMSYIKQAIMWCIPKRGWMWHSSQTVPTLLSDTTKYTLSIIFASKRIWILDTKYTKHVVS